MPVHAHSFAIDVNCFVQSPNCLIAECEVVICLRKSWVDPFGGDQRWQPLACLLPSGRRRRSPWSARRVGSRCTPRRETSAATVVLVCAVAASCVHAPAPRVLGPPTRPPGSPCFEEQVRIEGFCVDKYEAYVVELDPQSGEHPHAPYDVIGDKRVRA